MEVKQIDSKDTLRLRQLILRPNAAKKDCIFPGDTDENTFHLGAYVQESLVSVASFYLENSPLLDEEYQYRLRGMATLEDYRKQGMSRALLNTAFPLILRNNVKTVWCNAREEAVGFYHQLGFEKMGERFEIEGIGPHFFMFKYLSQ